MINCCKTYKKSVIWGKHKTKSDVPTEEGDDYANCKIRQYHTTYHIQGVSEKNEYETFTLNKY